MAQDRVVLRKAGWTTDFIHPRTGKRTQNRVGSEDEGWAIIHAAHEAARVQHNVDAKAGKRVKTAPIQQNGSLSIHEAFQLSWDKRWRGQKSTGNIESHLKQIEEYFGRDTQLVDITGHWLDLFRKQLLSEGNKPSTVNRKVSVLRSMRTDAVRFGKLIDVPTWPPGLTEERIPPRWLDPQEILLLRDYFQRRARRSMELPSQHGGWAGRGPCSWTEMEDAFLLRLNHGSRCQETINVKRRDIQVSQGLIQITFIETKNGFPRTVRVEDPECREILLRRMEGKGLDERLFRMKWRVYCDNFAEAVKELGLPGRVTGHITRGTFATVAITNGTPLPVLQHFCGWRELDSVNHYAHNDTRQQEIVLDAVKGIAQTSVITAKQRLDPCK